MAIAAGVFSLALAGYLLVTPTTRVATPIEPGVQQRLPDDTFIGEGVVVHGHTRSEIACVVRNAAGRERLPGPSALRAFEEEALSVNGIAFEPLVVVRNYVDGDTIECDGGSPLVLARGTAVRETVMLAGTVFGAFAMAFGVVALIGLRRGVRR